MALSSKAGDEAVQVKKAAESTTAELRQSLQKEHERAEALNGELAKARRDLETQVALSSKAGDEAVQVKKAAESTTAELRQSLQKEHERAEALNGELAKARRDLETQVALSSKAGDEAVQVKKARRERDGGAATVAAEGARAGRGPDRRACEGAAGPRDAGGAVKQGGRRGGAGKKAAESTTAELRQSLQKEHERAEALNGELAKARRDLETQVALSSKASDEAAQVRRLPRAQRRSCDSRCRRNATGPRRWPKDIGGNPAYRRSGSCCEHGRRERDRRAPTVAAEGARQGRGADERACEGEAGKRDAGGGGETRRATRQR